MYFIATGVLADGGVSGSDNLYLLHDTGSGWTTTYIASLSPEDKPDWYAQAFSAPYLAQYKLACLAKRPLSGVHV